jgi:hypothetical protein
MAEEFPRDNEPFLGAGQQDDVVGKIDQLLNRHRPRPPAIEAVPLLTDAPRDEEVAIDDGIPVLTDAVTGSSQPAPLPSAPARSATISTVLILRRMAVALDAEHARLRVKVGGDTNQIHMLDRLVAELKRALPGAVRSAITDQATDPVQPGGDGRL